MQKYALPTLLMKVRFTANNKLNSPSDDYLQGSGIPAVVLPSLVLTRIAVPLGARTRNNHYGFDSSQAEYRVTIHHNQDVVRGPADNSEWRAGPGLCHGPCCMAGATARLCPCNKMQYENFRSFQNISWLFRE